MKRYYTLIILSVLLVLASTWTQASNMDSLSLFETNLKEEVLDSQQQVFGLQEDAELKKWITELNLQGNLITAEKEQENSTRDDGVQEEKKLVKGITFYNDQKEIEEKVGFFSKEEIIVRKNTGLQLAVLPGVLVDGSYELTEARMDSNLDYDLHLKQQLGFDIDYKLNHRLNLNAGYYLTGEQESDGYNLTGMDSKQRNFDSSEGSTENIQKIGIDYDTSERTSVFANYFKENSATDEATTTVVGVKYNDDEEQIAFQYQIEDLEEKRLNSTGVEVGINDFAKLKAIYTMIDDDNADKVGNGAGKDSNFESKLLDLGLDLYVNDDTSLKLGYQLSDKDEADGSQEIWESLKPEQANVELEFKF